MKVLSFVVLVSVILFGNNNINNSGSFVNNGTINNTQTNNYEGEKSKFDTRIKQLASQILKNPGAPEQPQISAVISAAKQANEFNISSSEKREKCIEHAISIGLLKVKASFARKECSKIFN